MRVFVTGLGIVSPLGCGARATMDRLLAGEQAFAPLTLFDASELRTNLAAEVRGLAVPAGWSRADTMAVTAAREALLEAGLTPARDIHLIVGGSTGGMYECEEILARLKREIDAPVDREIMRSQPLSSASDRIHHSLGPFARTEAVCSACSGGATAILLGAGAIRTGRIERALVGGVDALCRLAYAGFSALGAVDVAPCRPFDRSRAGLSLGEAAAFLVLESEASLQARGGRAIAELAGWAIASEAHHITHPEPSGATAAEVMRLAIEDAGLVADDVDYINAHGTATPHNDPMESAAIARCFGADAHRVWVSSIKGSIGHTLGAAGAIEAAVTAMTVERGEIPPTVGLREPDEACPLRHVRTAERTTVRAALSNAFGFGGTDTALLLRAVAPASQSRLNKSSPSQRAPTPRAPRRLAVTGASCIGPLGFFGRAAGYRGALAYAAPGPRPKDEPCAIPEGALDLMRARRLDRAARLATVVIADALNGGDGRAGVVVGTAHSSVSATTQIIRRIFEKGMRHASPGVFPCVLPSALASHASIYLGLRGPAFACSDLSTSAEAALAIACDMVASRQADRVVAAAVDEHNEVAAKVSAPLTSGIVDRGARAEGAAALAIESLAAAGERALCEVAWRAAWRGEAPAIPSPSAASGRAAAFLARECALDSEWRGGRVHVISERAGDHESVGGIALVTAVSAIHEGELDEVLVLGTAPDRGYGWILRRIEE